MMRLLKIHIVFLLLLTLVACEKETNWSYTLDKNSTEPFGLYLAYDQLEHIFPLAEKETIYDINEFVHENRHKWKRDKQYTLLISITNRLQMSKEEAEDLYVYISNGGFAVLVSDKFSDEIDSTFDIKNIQKSMHYPYTKEDSASTYDILWDDEWYSHQLDMPFAKDYFEDFTGWGMRKVGDDFRANLIMRDIGEGQIMFGNSPEMLTNYALLKDSNIKYFEKLFSIYGRSTSYVKWFSKKDLRAKHKRSKSNLSTLLEQRPYRFAFFTLLAMAILFLGFETRRRQRQVAVVPPVTNDSLAFTETIGKLYYGERDNRNLAGKMIQYYLEYIRTTYNIPTTHLNKEMAARLARKLNKPTEEIEKFVHHLNNYLAAENLSEESIKKLYHTLKKYN